MEAREDELTLDDIVRVLKSQWKIVFIPALLISIAVFVFLRNMPPRYEAYSLIRIGTNAAQPFESAASIREIMDSLPATTALAAKIKENAGNQPVALEKGSIKYEATSDLLRISAVSGSRERSLALVTAAADMLFERHKKHYADALKELEVLVRYVREVVNPLPLSSGLSDFRIVPTKIEVEPVASNEPVARKSLTIAFAVFFIVLFIDTLAAFYVAGKGTGH